MADNFFKVSKGITYKGQAADPSNPTNGDMYYNTTRSVYRKYENGVWTDIASGADSQAKLIKGGTWTWSQVNNVLSWSADAYISTPGVPDVHNTIQSTAILMAVDSLVAYVDYNRVGTGATNLSVTVAGIAGLPVQSGRYIFARRVGNDVLIGDFLLKDGESLELDGANAEISRRLNQLRLTANANFSKVNINSSDAVMLDGATLSQELNTFVMNFGGAVINFQTGAVLAADDSTALGVNFTPFSIPVSNYFWYGIGVTASGAGSDNRMAGQVTITQAASANGSPSLAVFPNISGDKRLGAVQVFNNAGTIQVSKIVRFGPGGGSSGGSGTANTILETLKNEFVDSPYSLLTPNIVKLDGVTKFGTLTGAASDLVTNTVKFSANSQSATSIQMLDSQWLALEPKDIGSVDLSLFWNSTFNVPSTTITYTSLSIATLNGSAVVTVTTPVHHHLATGSKINVTTATAVGGISSGNLSVSGASVTVVDASTFKFTAGGSASSSTTGTLDSLTVVGYLYEVSRDGGTNWFTIPLVRVGTTDTFRAPFTFDTTTTTESTKQTIVTQTVDDTTNSVDSVNIAFAQAFTIANPTKLQEVTLKLSNFLGTAVGSVFVSIIKDSNGFPSTALSDIICQSNPTTVASLGLTGTPTNKTFTIPGVVVGAGTYHVVFTTDSVYKSGIVSVTTNTIGYESRNTGASAPFASSFSAGSWSSLSGNLVYTVKGRALDLRVRISSPTSGSITYPNGLDGYGIFYNFTDVGIVSSVKKSAVRAFNSVTDNLNTFTIGEFNLDPDLLTIYAFIDRASVGVFKASSGAFTLAGNTVTFPTDTFKNGGVSAPVVLMFDQNTGGAFDGSDSNRRLLSGNHLGSTNGADDTSVAGRGLILRDGAGTLRELELNTLGYPVVASSPGGSVLRDSTSPTTLDDTAATRLGLKQYLHGTTYNGGNAPTITLSVGGGTLNSVTRGLFIPYQMNDGTWRLKYSFVLTLSNATRTSAVLAIAGITFKNVSSWNQPVIGYVYGTNTAIQSYANPNLNTVEIDHSSQTTSIYESSGDVELDSKPTWAY